MSRPVDGAAVEQVAYLVEEQSNPSTDCFVLPAVSARGFRALRCGFADLPAADALTDTVVVFVRYVPRGWARLVEAARPRLRALVFFMDDDVLDMRASAGMPWHYRWKLARLAAGRRRWLRRHQAELWVSTPYLQKKYAEWGPRLVLPFPASKETDVRRVFYHGTASHDAEKRWLRPVLEEALRREERLAFEIVGGPRTDSYYRGLSRVSVVHQMKWPAYQDFLSLQGRHVGLAPVMDTPFNRARSYTKFFDITRCGAVGIYSPNSACAEVVEHGVDGQIVELDRDAWVEAILTLVRDDSLREKMLRNAESKLDQLTGRAQAAYSELSEARQADTRERQ
jgi:hypothetical protein